MSFRNKTVALVLLAMSSVPAFAQDQDADLQAAITDALNGTEHQVVAVMEDGVVTLTGLASKLDRAAAEKAAMEYPGVTEVRNQITES